MYGIIFKLYFKSSKYQLNINDKNKNKLFPIFTVGSMLLLNLKLLRTLI